MAKLPTNTRDRSSLRRVDLFLRRAFRSFLAKEKLEKFRSFIAYDFFTRQKRRAFSADEILSSNSNFLILASIFALFLRISARCDSKYAYEAGYSAL